MTGNDEVTLSNKGDDGSFEVLTVDADDSMCCFVKEVVKESK